MDLGGLGWGMLGLGAGADIFSAYSNMQQQQRQRDLYKKQLQLSQQMQDPNAMVAGSQPYVDALNKNLQTQIPNIMRSTVAPQLGMSGIDPSGGQGQLILNQALAPYYAQNAQSGMQNYMNSLMGAQGALSGAGGSVGQSMGSGGNTAQALQMMMLMQALKGGGSGTQTPSVPGIADANSMSGTYSSFMPGINPQTMGALPMAGVGP